MEKKDKWRLGIVYVFIFLIAFVMDIQGGSLEEDNVIFREETGGESRNVDLFLTVEDILEDYEISLEIEPRRITEKEANNYFAKAIEEIDADFQSVDRTIPIKELYVDELVEAEWSFSPGGIVGTDGVLRLEELPEEGILITASAILNCGVYEKIYTFPFWLEKPEFTKQEEIEKELSKWVEEQQRKEGTDTFQLPQVLGGMDAEWSEKNEFLFLKVLMIEGVSFVTLIFLRKKEEEETIRKRREQRELQYPEIVNHLLILMEAGMTTRQAWHKIAYQYKEKQKKNLIADSEVYEAIVQMDRLLLEGEKERVVYEGFVNQMDSMCYRRLIRLLVNNLEKGSKDICQQLSLEVKQAYEQRVLLAKKLGEEASTKMLVPMMLMMVLVMIIVMAPAIMGFSM